MSGDARMARDLWQTACAAQRAGFEPDWQAVADYRRPLLVFFSRRFHTIGKRARRELVRDVLRAIEESLQARLSHRRSRFRDFLHGVIADRVLAYLQSQRREVLGTSVEHICDEAAGAEVELVAETLGAVRRWLEVVREPERAQVVKRQIRRGQRVKAIAREEDLPPETVQEWLRDARLTVTADLLERTLDLPTRCDRTRLAATVLEALARIPSKWNAALSELGDSPLRESLAGWLQSFRGALAGFVRHEADAGGEPQWVGLEDFLAAP